MGATRRFFTGTLTLRDIRQGSQPEFLGYSRQEVVHLFYLRGAGRFSRFPLIILVIHQITDKHSMNNEY